MGGRRCVLGDDGEGRGICVLELERVPSKEGCPRERRNNAGRALGVGVGLGVWGAGAGRTRRTAGESRGLCALCTSGEVCSSSRVAISPQQVISKLPRGFRSISHRPLFL